jgi:hypothetical protein
MRHPYQRCCPIFLDAARSVFFREVSNSDASRPVYAVDAAGMVVLDIPQSTVLVGFIANNSGG